MFVWLLRRIALIFVIACCGLITTQVFADENKPPSQCLRVSRNSDLDYWLFDLNSGRFAERVPEQNDPTSNSHSDSILSSDKKYLLEIKPASSTPDSPYKLVVSSPGGVGPGWTIQSGLSLSLPTESDTRDPNEIDFLWLPDNRHIVYQWRDINLENKHYLAVTTPGSSTKVVRDITLPANDSAFTLNGISGDGKYLAGVSHLEDEAQLMFWSTTDLQPIGDPVNVTLKACGSGNDYLQEWDSQRYDCAAWASGGSQVAYIAAENDETSSLVIRDLATGQEHRSVAEDLQSTNTVYWTPDDQYVFIVSTDESTGLRALNSLLTIFRSDGSKYDSLNAREFQLDWDNWSSEKKRLFFYYYNVERQDQESLTAAIYDFKTQHTQIIKQNARIDEAGYLYPWSFSDEMFKGKYWLLSWDKSDGTYAGVLDVDTGNMLFESVFDVIYDRYWLPDGGAVFGGGESVMWWTPGTNVPHHVNIPDSGYLSLRGLSPDHEWALFSDLASDAPRYISDIGVLNLKTGKYRLLFDQTGTRLTYDVANVFSPDGHTIVQWTNYDDPKTMQSGIAINWADLNSEWSHITVFENVASDPFGESVAWAWSPDGSKAAFSYFTGKDQNAKALFVLDLYTNRGDLIRRYNNFTYANTLKWQDCSIN